MLKKTLITMTLLATLMLSACIVSATDLNEDTEQIGMRYKYIERVSVGLSIKDGTAKVTTEARDVDGDTTSMRCTATLQKKSGDSWKKVRSWSKSTQSNVLSLSKTKAVSKGKYRVKSVVNAYKGNNHETVTKYSSTASY